MFDIQDAAKWFCNKFNMPLAAVYADPGDRECLEICQRHVDADLSPMPIPVMAANLPVGKDRAAGWYIHKGGYVKEGFIVLWDFSPPNSTIFHELVHAWQEATGRLVSLGDYCFEWEGKFIDRQAYDYLDLPWEREAWMMQRGLFAEYCATIPDGAKYMEMELYLNYNHNERLQIINERMKQNLAL